jgi:hydroxymethylpyrimidine pyrophosphatase-like HAD family hydrolase
MEEAELAERPAQTSRAAVMLPAMIATDVDGTLLDENDRVTDRPRRGAYRGGRGGDVRAGHRTATALDHAGGRRPGFAPMSVCANGAVLYDPADRPDHLGPHPVGRCAAGAGRDRRTRHSRGRPAVERWRSAHDAATAVRQFTGYEHAWLNPDNTEVSREDLLSAPAVKLLIRKAGARSADMAAELARYLGPEGDITYSTNNGLIEVVPPGSARPPASKVAARWASPPSDIVAFGDMPNDVPMLRWSGLGVAMGNAHGCGGGGQRGDRAEHRRRAGPGAGTVVAERRQSVVGARRG